VPVTPDSYADLTDPARWQTKFNQLFAEVPIDPAAEKDRESDSPPPPTEPGERRRYRFRENRFNNTLIAERSGLDITTIGRFRKGVRTPSADALPPLALAFDTDPLWWMLPCSASPLDYRLSTADAAVARALARPGPESATRSLLLRVAAISSPEVLELLDRLVAHIEGSGGAAVLPRMRGVLKRLDAEDTGFQ
jgi:transcriptional regulator with XRE-family HTH domain